MSLVSAISCVEAALSRSKKCSTGLTAQARVFGIEKGPSTGPEILATLYLDDPFFGFWYGHILQHPRDRRVFVSQVVWTDKFINAGNVSLLFQRFHYWIKDRLEYHPCGVQNADDAYAESHCVEAAATALALMIEQFDVDKRAGFEGSGFEDSPTEGRVVEIYGLADKQDKRNKFPPVPMPTALKLVKAPQ